MSQIDNTVASLMSAASSDFGKANPNNGQGSQGEWPPKGDHDLFIIGCKESVADLNVGGGQKRKGVEIQFQFLWTMPSSDPSFDPSNPKSLEFWGERFKILPGYETLVSEDGLKTSYRISNDRFLGHLTKILRVTKDQIPSPTAAYTQAKSLIENGESRVMIRARIDERTSPSKDGKKTYINKTEYILDRLS